MDLETLLNLKSTVQYVDEVVQVLDLSSISRVTPYSEELIAKGL